MPKISHLHCNIETSVLEIKNLLSEKIHKKRINVVKKETERYANYIYFLSYYYIKLK